MKRVLAILAVGTIAFACVARADLVDGIQAIIHDSIVTHQDVAELTRPALQSLERQYRGQNDMFQKKLAEAEHDNLEQLVSRQLILHEFKTAYNVPESILDKDVDKEIEDRVKSQFGDRMRMIKTLQAEGITYEKYRQQIRDRFIVAALRHKNISQEIIISPHKVEVYYLAHRDEFKMEDEAKLRMIVLNNTNYDNTAHVEELAEEILAKLKEGAPFDEMAKIHSEGSQGKAGGDWGWWERQRLNPGLADIAFTLQPGQRSGVISRSNGEDFWVCQYESGQPKIGRHYVVDQTTKKESMVEERKFETADAATNLPPAREFYIMLVEDKRMAHYKSLGEVRDQIEKGLVLEEQSRLEKQWIERLKKKTFVRYF
jgi:peptidyl-prolyl cis-trans isomerase SurA